VSDTRYRTVRLAASGEVLIARVVWGTDFWTKFRGLMFRRHLPIDEGVIFVYGRESKVETSIHMFFMRFEIACLWLDKEGRVVDMVLAKRWRPAYAPRTPAQYVLEAHPSVLERVKVGDLLAW